MAEDTFYIDPETGRRYHVGGCLFSKEPASLPKYGALSFVLNELPPLVDLRQFMTTVEDQGDTNSCVGNALASAYEFLVMVNNRKQVGLSRLFIYYNGRLKDGFSEYKMKDDGCTIVSAVEGLKEFGCCKEDMFEFVPENVNRMPPDYCYLEAEKYRIMTAEIVDINLDDMKACLAEGYPFVFCLLIYRSFRKAAKNGGRVRKPKFPFDTRITLSGGHAMLAVGYSDLSNCFIVRNSFGENWGDEGYCYIPYEYMSNPKYCVDAHVIKVVSDDVNRHRKPSISVCNPYIWNYDKDKPFYVPPDYDFPHFDYTFFWKPDDTFNYMKYKWINGHAQPIDEDTESIESGNEKSLILWIDNENSANSLAKELKDDENITINYCDTFSQAEIYLWNNKDKIISSPTFQIICRGYNKDENKSPLDLLNLLNHLELSDVPILVFTSNRVYLESRFENQAPSMDIFDWKERLFITSNAKEIVAKTKENISNSYYSSDS